MEQSIRKHEIVKSTQRSESDRRFNKLAAANLFTTMITSAGYEYSGNEAAETAKTLLSGVTSDKDAGLASVQAFFDSL